MVTEYEELAVRLRAIEDLTMVAKALKDFAGKHFNKGYDACSTDYRKVRAARAKAREKSFQEELDIINDVMSGPFDIDHQ